MPKPPPQTPDPTRRPELLALIASALRPPEGPRPFEECLRGLRRWADESGPERALVDAVGRLEREAHPGREYHRIFLRPGGREAPPFESVYRESRVFGSSTAGFLEALREAGLEPMTTFRLPPDHVALEIEFLAHLEARARVAGEGRMHEEAREWSDRARDFVDRRLARWLPSLLARMESGAPDSPYTDIVRATLGILRIAPGGRRGGG